MKKTHVTDPETYNSTRHVPILQPGVMNTQLVVNLSTIRKPDFPPLNQAETDISNRLEP